MSATGFSIDTRLMLDRVQASGALKGWEAKHYDVRAAAAYKDCPCGITATLALALLLRHRPLGLGPSTCAGYSWTAPRIQTKLALSRPNVGIWVTFPSLQDFSTARVFSAQFRLTCTHLTHITAMGPSGCRTIGHFLGSVKAYWTAMTLVSRAKRFEFSIEADRTRVDRLHHTTQTHSSASACTKYAE
jgi:hypothetical protein